MQIYNDKDIKLFNDDFIDIDLKTSQNVGKSKKYDLVLEIAVPGTKNSLLFIVFLDSHFVVSTD